MKKILILIILVVSIILFYCWQSIYLPISCDVQEEKLFMIEKGTGVKEISLLLQKQRLIKNSSLFNLYVFWEQSANKLQAGEYLLSPSMTVPEIVSKLIKGEIIEQEITIIEGWNKDEVAQYLEDNQIFSSEDFLVTMNDSNKFTEDYNFLRDVPEELGLEGYLFPDTYNIYKNVSPEEMIKKMLDNFDSKLNLELREEIERQEKSIFEIIIMASLIEKEVRTIEDKKIVSGILWKRIRLGIPLQVDATIAYITGRKTTKIYIKETEIDSPYNTYKYRGLPLGPICNPGFESISASIYYKDSDYLYYLSTPEGETIFSRTLEEHNIAKAKYLN